MSTTLFRSRFATFCATVALLLAVGVWASNDAGSVSRANANVWDEWDERFDTRRDVLIAARRAPLAPALADGTWINSAPLKTDDLRGRVVLLDFWTYNCYNCRNTLPFLKRMDERYRKQGLTIIGVHSPEGDSAKNLDRVRGQVRALGLRYPVVTDNNYDSWRAYQVQAWPTVVILDKQGRIRFTHIGENMYAEQEMAIRRLLTE